MGVATDRSRLCLKRLLDELHDTAPKCKRIYQIPPPPATNLSPYLQSRSPAPRFNQNQSLFKVGPYILFERYDEEETYRASHIHTQQQYTCKALLLHGSQEKLAVYGRLGSHENICGLLNTVIGQNRLYIFLPDHHGDLHAYVCSRKRVGEEEARPLFAQMLKAVAHCHNQGVVLRDLKLRRFVFTDQYRTQIALFGFDDCVLLHGDHDDDSLTDRHGCPAYVGPELLTNGNTRYSGRAADIWSLGVSLYTMLIGRYPFQDTQPAALFAKIRRGAFSLPGWLSPQAKCLIGCMLRKTPAERLEASELLMHPWLTDLDMPHRPYQSSLRAQQNKQGDDDQVVPIWTEKH